jgi:hypothetical protein
VARSTTQHENRVSKVHTPRRIRLLRLIAYGHVFVCCTVRACNFTESRTLAVCGVRCDSREFAMLVQDDYILQSCVQCVYSVRALCFRHAYTTLLPMCAHYKTHGHSCQAVVMGTRNHTNTYIKFWKHGVAWLFLHNLMLSSSLSKHIHRDVVISTQHSCN